MEKSYFKIYAMVLIVSLIAIVQGSTLVKYKDTCHCEQLLNENECLAAQICNFTNNKCVTIPCDLLPVKHCTYNERCALVNNQCVNFQTCSSHNAKTEDDCFNLNHNCDFDDNTQTCQESQPINFGSCSDNLFSLCVIGNEGLCVKKDGICQEMTKCEDAKDDMVQCLLAFPACEMTKDNCLSRLSCSQLEQDICALAKEKINGDKYYLCSEGSKGCADFDPSIQTKETCGQQSSLFYHWDGNECSRCSWDSIIVSVLIVVFLILSI